MKHAYFFIVILLVLKSRFKTTESFVCEPPSIYHNHTRTCVRLVTEKLDYFKARSYCEYNWTGSADRKTHGHLMFIFDNETNSFIKEQLKTWNFEKVLIGLHDAVMHKYYRWEAITHQSYNATYFDWATRSNIEDTSKRSVVITPSGWQKHNMETFVDFICQSNSVTPNILLKCPSAKEGKQDHQLQCSVDTLEDSQNSSVKICRNDNNATCLTNVTNTNMQTHGSNITAQLNISSVRRKDEGTWTCFISFTVSSSSHHMNKSCNLAIYSFPKTPTCQHTSNTTHVLVTCSTSIVYPEARCLWKANFGTAQVLRESSQHKKYTLDEDVYYNTTCSASFRPNITGTYTIVVTMFALHNQPSGEIQQDHNVTIRPPDCPSQFNVKLINNDSVIISWTPGHNGGLTQTFVFYSHTNTSLDMTLLAAVDDDTNETMVFTAINTSLHRTLVAAVVVDENDTMSHIVKKLHMMAPFFISVQVYNVLGTTEFSHLNVSVIDADLENSDTRRTASDKILLYSIIPSCSVALIAVVTAVAVRKGCCRADSKEKQNKTRTTPHTTSLNLPVDEDGYLIALTAIRGLPRTEHTQVQPVVAGDDEHESFSNVRVSVMDDSEHALEGTNNDDHYHVIQETD